MGELLRRARRRGWRRLIWLIFSFLVLCSAVFVFFPAALLNQQTAARLTDYLVRRLGSDAVCAKVGIGFTSAVLEGIVLPLDSLGTKLEIEKIEVSLDPLVALSQPRAPERIITGIRIERPVLTVSTKTRSRPDSSGAFNAKQFFDVIGRADSLHSFVFSGGSVALLTADSSLTVLEQVGGYVRRNSDGTHSLRLAGHGNMIVKYGVSVDGSIDSDADVAEISATIHISEGEFQLPVSPPSTLSCNGGDVDMQFRLTPAAWSLSGVATVYSLLLEERAREWYIAEAGFAISDSSVALGMTKFSGPGVSGEIAGSLFFRENMKFAATGQADLSLPDLMKALAPDVSAGEGQAKFDFVASGFPDEWEGTGMLRADSLRGFGVAVSSLVAHASMSSDTLSLDSLIAHSGFGNIFASAKYPMTAGADISGRARLTDLRLPEILGVSPALSSIGINVAGPIGMPKLGLNFQDRTGLELAEAQLALRGDQIELMTDSPYGKSYICVTTDSAVWNVAASNVQRVLSACYPELNARGEALASSQINYSGDRTHGELFIDLQAGESNRALSGIAANLSFAGTYAQESDKAYRLEGEWHGTGGDGIPFDGEGIIHAGADWLDIERLFIDEFGTLSGSYDYAESLADVNFSLDRLPLSRIPYAYPLVQRLNLGGYLTGELSAKGPLSDISWRADVNMVDGTAAGVPGFWSVIVASGKGLCADSLDLSFGRDVRGILHTSGRLDLKSDSIDVRAEFVEADCADFLLALTGMSGLLSGDLQGDVRVFGQLASPELLASLTVTGGELLGEIYVDEFSLDAVAGADERGHWTFVVPKLFVSKKDTYSFSGELATEPVKGGKFAAQITGEGDFLNLVQQVDADFTSRGSRSALLLEFGGTWDRPAFGGGTLRVEGGKFTYPPAAPGELAMNILLHLNQSGVLDTGLIAVASGKDSLLVGFLPPEVSAQHELLPLVIPSPHVTLGVIRISTSEDGINLRLPGFMKPEWLGILTTGTELLSPVYISALDSTRLAISGQVDMRDSRFTFPFFRYGGARVRPVTKWLVDRLFEAQWSLDVALGGGNRYDVEVTGFKDSDLFKQLGGSSILRIIADYVDHISLDAVVSPTEEPLHLHGSLMDSSFFVIGSITASSGTADYLDQTFFVDELSADFDETDIMPVLSGRAETYGVDSVGRTVPVYLTIYEIDPETNSRLPQGRFEDVTYVLEADGYSNPEAVLALLGYDFENIGEGKAEQILARTAFSAAKRAWLDPISRSIEKSTFLDVVALNPGGGVSPSLFRQQRENVLTDTLQSQGVIKLLKGSHLTVGKYLARDLFVTYTGELSEAADRTEGDRLGLIHFWNLQYRVQPVSPDFLLDFAVEYDEANRRRDESVSLKYSFTLEP